MRSRAAAVATATALALVTAVSSLDAQRVLYRSDAFTVTDTSVREGPFEAVATSPDTILSTYPRAASEIHFRFSINGLDNEFAPGIDHLLNLRPQQGRIVTPVYTFGVPPEPTLPPPESAASGEDGPAQVTIRLDMRHVVRALREHGVYDPPRGDRITRIDGVYVMGDVAPMTWDRRQLHPGVPQQLTDPDGDGIFTVTLPFEARYTRPRTEDGRAIWARRLPLRGFPELTTPEPIVEATHRLSLEELQQLVRDDGALSAGAKWPGVWTRDVSLSAVLALAIVAPDAVKTSLMAKVDSAGRIIQDTGTGGSWPVSTDRMTWALAAWEVYAVTGDRQWLETIYPIIERSAEADRHAAVDEATGLVFGESSFLDWREQSYPRWMQPADIYESQALGTNAVHYGAYRALAAMARALDRPAARWDAVADSIRTGMTTHLWQPSLGWYAQFRYGRVAKSRSPRAEALGEALAVRYGAASQAQAERIARSEPRVAFGVPTFYPFVGGVPFYHNGTIWPFVTAYATWAAADAGNTAAVEHGLASLLRATALFLTNKENMAAATGHFEGTALNSDRQLWSVAGMLAASYRVLFGMRFEPDRLVFRPMVPPAYAGTRTLAGVHYRGAVLTITVHGSGTAVARARVDGAEVPRAEIAALTTGAHTVELELDGHWPDASIDLVEPRIAPATPVAMLRGTSLAWEPIPSAVRYVVHRDGFPMDTVTATEVTVQGSSALAEYQVMAIDAQGLESFLSEPVRVVSPEAVMLVQPSGALEREHAGFTGDGYLRLERERNTNVQVPVRIGQAGRYAIDVRYANGSGPVNTDSKAAVRTLLVDGREQGVVVMPQRGVDLWSDWGYSNTIEVALPAGTHALTIRYTPLDANMNGYVNTALLDHVRLTRLGRVPSR